MAAIHTILSKIDQAKLEEICRRKGILAAYLFGSQAEGYPDALSDIDIGIVFPKGKDLSNSALISASLSLDFYELLGDFIVDIVLLQKAGPLVAENAIRGKILFSADDEERLKFEDYTLMEALDFRPWIEEYYKDMWKEIRRA